MPMQPSEPGKLDLSDRQLMSVPPHAWRNKSLRVLNLYRNKLKILPREIAYLTGLQVVILANNQLRTLPEELGALRHLRMLDAGHNLIGSLPRSFAKLTNLTDYLYLHDNRLQALCDSVFDNFIHLRYLNLSDNPLRGLPTSLSALVKLEELRLESIGLETLPGFVASLSALDELALRNNRLAELPSSSRNFASCATLICAGIDSCEFLKFCAP
jgi:Leucine-rich repeat (LRR) protein